MPQRVQRHVAQPGIDQRRFVPIVHCLAARRHRLRPSRVAAALGRRAEEEPVVVAGAPRAAQVAERCRERRADLD